MTLVEAVRQAVPPGRDQLSETEISMLRGLTAALIEAKPEAAAEYERFLGIGRRELCLPEAELADRIGGATVLVTGGTGCIGSVLMAQLAALRPARLVSVSRGVATRVGARPLQPEAEYLRGDVTDRDAITALIADVRPDIVFHVAAQRSPALAEAEVYRTVSTNTLGARNVLAAAAQAGTRQVVLASTGKALRPYSPEVYTASKRAAEWAGAAAAATGPLMCSAARFTHVIDNSIVHQRLLAWAAANSREVADTGEAATAGQAAGTVQAGSHGSEAIRLHSAEIAFYAQSALESAQLLLIAMLGGVPGEFRVHAIRDLGWPVSLLDLTLGVLQSTRSTTPIYISGYDPGYEKVPFPGLYDPLTAGDVSPLLNAFEAVAAATAPCPMTDAFRLQMAPHPAAPKLFDALDRLCAHTQDGDAIRHSLDELSWSLLDATLAAADTAALRRSARMTQRLEDSMSPTHQRITRAITAYADHC